AEPELEPGPEPEGEGVVRERHGRDPRREARGELEGARLRPALRPREGAAELHWRRGRNPDARVLGIRASTQPRDDACPRRDEPALATAAEDGDGALGNDADAERVRERAVVARAHDGRQRDDAPEERRAVEGEQVRADGGGGRAAHAVPDRRRRARDLDGRDREHARLACERIAAGRSGGDRAAGEKGAPGRQKSRREEPGDAVAGGARRGRRRGRCPGTRLPHLRALTRVYHAASFGAEVAAPTSAAGGRGRRGTRPRGRARPRTARARAGGPRP